MSGTGWSCSRWNHAPCGQGEAFDIQTWMRSTAERQTGVWAKPLTPNICASRRGPHFPHRGPFCSSWKPEPSRKVQMCSWIQPHDHAVWGGPVTREVREKPRKSSVSGIRRIFQEKGSSRLWQMVRKRRKGKRVFSFFFHNNRIKDGWRTPQLPCSCCGGMSALQ